jgi:hypothetical protein
MATSSSNLNGVTSDPGTEVKPDFANITIPAKSFVVGKYNPDGKRKTQGEMVGGSGEATRLNKLLLESMRRGGELLPDFFMSSEGPIKLQPTQSYTPTMQTNPTNKAKGKHKKIKEQTHNYPKSPEPANTLPSPVYEAAPQKIKPHPKKLIEVLVDFGKIKMMVDEIIETTDAFALIFESKDYITCEPDKGHKLVLLYNGSKFKVMYLGILFKWIDSEQQVMLFIKDYERKD